MKRSTKKLGQKILSVVSAAAMAFASFTGIGAAAADSNIILENQTYNGGMEYIKTILAPEYSGKSAIQLTYEYESLDADGKYVVEDVEDKGKEKAVDYSDTFEFVAFDMNWGGWIPTGAGVEKGVTPVVGTQYTSTVTIADIEGKLDAECQGFNFATGAIGDTKVKLIKMEYVNAEQVTAGAEFTGSWEKGKSGSFTRVEGNATISCNEWYIAIRNLYVAGFKNPTIAVTVDYKTASNAYVQAEIFNGQGDNAKQILNYYPYVDKTGEVTYTTQFSNDLTVLSVCYDKCVVKEIRIYDDTEGDVTVSVTGKTAAQVAADMGIAWNLGNALECVDMDGKVDEVAWSNPRTTKKLIQAVKAQGFNTVRIPVSFLDKIGSNNKVDETYLARVKQVVDYAYDMGMYVVIDMHNDGGNGIATKWLDITKTGDDFKAIKTKFGDVWKSIATYFKDYDQKLVFEGYNELMNGNYNSSASSTELANINALAQQFVTEVRSADGQNTDRVLIVAGYNTNIDETVKGFEKPADTVADRLMLSVHYYDPWAFTLEENMNTTTWGIRSEVKYMSNQITKISDFGKTIGMPIFIGGYGAIDKDNTIYRADYCDELNYMAGRCGNVVTAYWDNGVTGLYGFGLFDRVNNTVTATGSTIISHIKAGREDGIADQD